MTGRIAGRTTRARMGALLVVALLASLLAAPAAHAEHYADVREVTAVDGVAAAVAYSKLAFPSGSNEALLGRADVFADSLASGALQKNAPLLLTASSDLSQPTEDELKRLGAKTVTILGGTSAVSAAVENDLKGQGYTVQRRSGATRIETAVAVARSAPKTTVALLARSHGGDEATAAFADALAAGGWAAQTGWPILLTESNRLSGPSAQFLREGTDQVWVVGGRAAVGDEVIAQIRALGVDAQRVSGPSRFDTAIAVASQRGFPSAAGATEVVLVDGQGPKAWTDGFAAAAYSGRNRAPIVLANSITTQLPAPTATFLKAGPSAKLLTGWTVPQAQVDEAAQSMGKAVALTRIFQVRMSGRNVVRPVADPDEPIWGHGEDEATGLLTMTVDDEAGAIDYTIETTAEGGFDDGGLTLRRGNIDKRGEAVVRFPDLDRDGNGSGRATSADFEADDFDLAEVIATPAAFYAEIVSNDYEQGAVRGQLPAGGEAHLPVTPSFTAIESKEADNWIRVKFASPVFVIDPVGKPLTKDDFVVTVDDGVEAPQPSTPANAFKEVPTTSDGALDSFLLVLESGLAPVANRETTVTLKSSGAAKLMNNVGQKPSSATQRQVTAVDDIRPQFTSLEAAGNSNLIYLNFSEPTWIDGTFPGTGLTISVRSGGSTMTPAPTATVPARPKESRSNRWPVTLSAAVPSGAEVRATLTSGAAALIKDAKGGTTNTLTGELSRAAAAGASGGLTEVSVSDVIVATSAAATSDQIQRLSVRVREPIVGPTSLRVTTPAESNPPTYGAVATVIVVSGMPTVTPTLTPANGGVPAYYTFAIAAGVRIADGTRIVIDFTDVDVPFGTAHAVVTSTKAFGLTVTRMDTGGTIRGGFDRRPGAHLSTALTPLTSSKSAQQQQFTVNSRGPNFAIGSVVTIDLSDGVDAGITYGALPTISNWTLDWSSNNRVIVATLTGTPGQLQFTLSAINVPEGVWGLNRRVVVGRGDADGTLGADDIRTFNILKDISTLVVTDVRDSRSPVPAEGGWGFGPTKYQEFSFKALGPLVPGDNVKFAFAEHRLSYRSANIAANVPGTLTLKKFGGIEVIYTAPSNAAEAIPSGTTVVIRVTNIDSRNSPKNPDGLGKTAVAVTRGLSTAEPWATTPLTQPQPFEVNLAPGIVVGSFVTGTVDRSEIKHEEGAGSPGGTNPSFGDQVGDRLVMTFYGGTPSIGDGDKITITEDIAAGTPQITLTCKNQPTLRLEVRCEKDPADPTRWLAVVTMIWSDTPGGTVNPITSILSYEIDSLTDMGASAYRGYVEINPL